MNTRILGRIVQEDYLESPRDDYNHQSNMVCWHSRYNLGDEQPSEPPDEWLAGNKPQIFLPLFLYDHSGITMNTTGFHCPWDSGQVGWIVANLNQIRKEHGWKRITTKRRRQIISWLNNEVEVYDQYLRGDIWGFRLIKQVKNAANKWIDEEHLESYFYFYGSDPKTNGMMDHIDAEDTPDAWEIAA